MEVSAAVLVNRHGGQADDDERCQCRQRPECDCSLYVAGCVWLLCVKEPIPADAATNDTEQEGGARHGKDCRGESHCGPLRCLALAIPLHELDHGAGDCRGQAKGECSEGGAHHGVEDVEIRRCIAVGRVEAIAGRRVAVPFSPAHVVVRAVVCRGLGKRTRVCSGRVDIAPRDRRDRGRCCSKNARCRIRQRVRCWHV